MNMKEIRVFAIDDFVKQLQYQVKLSFLILHRSRIFTNRFNLI